MRWFLRCACLFVVWLLPAAAQAQVVMAPGGGEPVVRIVDGDGHQASFFAYDPTFTGGVRAALGDVTGDGIVDIITAAGPTGGPHVKVFSGADLSTVASFYAYDPAFIGGIYVAAGDVNGDGRADIITGTGSGGGPHVKVFSGADLSLLASFYAYDPSFSGGVFVAAGDVNGDGRADIITGAGPGGGPHVRVFNGPDLSELASFYAFDPIFPGGVSVASADVNGDGVADIVAGAGPGGGPHVRVLSGADLSQLASFYAYDPTFAGGVSVAAADFDGDGRPEIVTAAGPGGGPHVNVFSAPDLSLIASFYAFDPSFTGGVLLGSLPGSGGALRFTSAAFTSFTAGSAGTFRIATANGTGTVTVTSTGTLPGGVTFTDNGDGTAILAGTPAAGSGGSYALTFTAIDHSATPVTQAFTLTVTQAPAITSAAATSFTTGAAGTFQVTTSGFPHPSITRAGAALPTGVTWIDNGDGTGTLGGTPAAGTSGSYAVTFTASNSVGAPVVQAFTLTVNAAPAFTSAATATFTVGSPGIFTVTTVANPTAALSVSGTLPSGVTLTDNGNGTALLGAPALAAGTGGVYPLTLTATNSAGSTTQAFTLTVQDKPAFTSPLAATFTVGVLGTFTVTTTTPAGSPTPALSASVVPAGLNFTDNGDGTGTLAGTATGTGGVSTVIFAATNTVGTATQSVMLTLNEVPLVTSANTTTFTVGTLGSFTVTTSGFPLSTLAIGGVALPAGVNFVNNGNGTGTLSGTPAAGTSGTYTLTFTATNTAGASAPQAFTLTVNGPPAFTSANATTFTGAGTFTVTTSGLPTPTLSVSGTRPSGVTFLDNGNGTGTLSGIPAAGTSGAYPLIVSATNSITTVTQNFTLTVSLPATRLVVTQVNGGVNPSAGVAFAVVVQAWDSVGPAVVTANTAVSLSRQTGTGTLGGTLTGTITSGSNSVTISGVTYTRAEPGVSITAARTSGNVLTSGTSASFTVIPGALASYLLTPASSSFLAGVVSQVTVQPQDGFGNPRTGAAAVTITGRNASDTANDLNVQIDADRNGTYGDTVVNTAAGAATFNIANGVAETFTLRASDGAITGLSAAITTTSGSPVLISEFRFRGPNGIRDEYINLYNNTDSPITVSTSDASTGWALVAADGVIRATIPNGTILPARGSYLITNNGAPGFSLTTYPAGAGTVGSGDTQYALDIPSSGTGAGIALFRSTLTFDLTTRLDAVGYTTAPALYREGAGMNAGGAEQVVNLNYAYLRNLATGIPADTDNNTADFVPVDTNGTLTGNGQRVGMPSPRSSASPIRRAQILQSSIPAVPSSVRDDRSYDWHVPGGGTVSWPSGVLSLAVRLTNTTGHAVTRLRVRIVRMTTFPSNSEDWDLRPIDATGTVTDSSGAVIASGLRPMMLESPQAQFNGGGINSTLTLDVSALPGGDLANGGSVDVHLLFGVAQQGTTNPFIASFIVEVLP